MRILDPFTGVELKRLIGLGIALLFVVSSALGDTKPAELKVIDRPMPNLKDKKFDLTGAPKDLASVPVPSPPDLAKYVRNKDAATLLGKALFWDMQVGGDGRTACATCHYHSGTDVRPRNTISPHGPGIPTSPGFRGANYLLKLNDFPFRKLADVFNAKSTVNRDRSEVVGAQGVIKRDFIAIVEGNAVDKGVTIPDAVFNIGGVNSRQVTGRNSPTMINAVFNDRQFWDGRANRYFNGVNPFGDTDPNARVWRANGAIAEKVSILIDNGSLASQASGPPNNDVEMSWNGRSFPQLGRKMLSLKPLALQKVAASDSVLGPYASSSGKGLTESITYASLIRDAFAPEWWQATGAVDGEYTHMEANFSLFWGLAIQLYEATLVSGETPYDKFAQGDTKAISDIAKQGLEIFLNQGKCINCHGGPEFAGGTISDLRPLNNPDQKELIERMVMGNGATAVYDNGFYNIGVSPTKEDLAVGADGPFGPFSYSRRRQLGQDIGDPEPVGPKDHIAVHGSFKTPTLRNIELTGPYFHNGGQKSLKEVMEFYTRGGDFAKVNMDDLDPDIGVIDELVGNQARINAVIEFMKTLTDPRVKYSRAPFDHPDLIIPNGPTGVANGVALDADVVIPAVGATGGEKLKTFEQVLLDGRPN